MKTESDKYHGRHLATISNDELGHIREIRPDLERAIDSELARRPSARTRQPATGYVPFPTQTKNVDGWVDLHRDLLAAKKADHPGRPAKVKDERKDKKRNEAES